MRQTPYLYGMGIYYYSHLYDNYLTMKDTDLMPFGKYKGTAMANVPAGYLLWARRNWSYTDATTPILVYIKDNLDAIQKEFNEEKRNRE